MVEEQDFTCSLKSPLLFNCKTHDMKAYDMTYDVNNSDICSI